MPRDGSNVYHRPSGTDAVPNTTVQSAPYNSYTADVEQDLNIPRPIVAGGTGATSADVALLNLSAEKAKQVVTNWDSTIWLPGSFYAATSATGAAPVAGHAFAGIVYYADATNFMQIATDLTDAGHPNYTRVMAAGVWGVWGATSSSLYVLKAGDTITGALTVNGLVTVNNDITLADPTPTINLNKAAGGNAAGLVARTGANIRWLELLGDTTAESGSNLGSDFVLQAYTDAGAPVVPPVLTVKRSLNRLLLAGDPVAALDAATKQYVDGGIGGLVTSYVRYDTAQALTAPQKAQARANIAAVLKGHLWGLTLSTGGGSAAFSVAAGEAADSTAVDLMVLASSLVKNTGSWVVGSAGALDTGAIASSTWYHVYQIKRPDTGVVDICISLSVTAPTFGGAIPAAYTLFRRIGAMKTNPSAQWTLFQQIGDEFIWDAPVLDVNGSGLGTTSTLYVLSVPLGLSIAASFLANYNSTAVGDGILVQSPLITTQAWNVPTGNYDMYISVANGSGSMRHRILTDTSARIRAVGRGTGTPAFYVITTGWTDTRGRLS